MNKQWFGSRAIGIGLAAALLTGCGGIQTGQSTMPQASEAVTGVRNLGHSWMLPQTKSQNLIYATFGCGGTCVLSYPDGALVGTLDVGDAGACADKSGNVYIADKDNLLEFAHGGTVPINTYTAPNAEVTSCSVDPTTGNVATTVNDNVSSNYSVAIFSSTTATPTTYLIASGASACGYDNNGNLFVDGPGSHIMLYELTKYGTSFSSVSITPSIQLNPGQVQWDGTYLALEGLNVPSGAKVFRLQLSGSSATVVRTIKFKGITKTASQSWINGNRIFIPYGIRGDGPRKTRIGVWNYPKGGKPLQAFKGFGQNLNLQAVTYSPATP